MRRLYHRVQKALLRQQVQAMHDVASRLPCGAGASRVIIDLTGADHPCRWLADRNGRIDACDFIRAIARAPAPTTTAALGATGLLLSLLLGLLLRLIGDIHVDVAKPLLHERLTQLRHLAFQRITDTQVRAHEGHLGLLLRRHVDPDIQTAEFGRLKLDIRSLEVLARQVHDAVDDAFGPATLMHGQRLVHQGRSRCGRCTYGLRGLAERSEAIGKVVDARVTGGAFDILQPLTDQTAERLVAAFSAAAFGRKLLAQDRQVIDDILIGVSFSIARRRLVGSLGILRSKLGFGSGVFQRQLHGIQTIKRIGVWVEGVFNHGRRCRLSGGGERRDHWRSDDFRTGWHLGYRGPGSLCDHCLQCRIKGRIDDRLALSQRRIGRGLCIILFSIRMPRVIICSSRLGWQIIAAIGNARLVGGICLITCRLVLAGGDLVLVRRGLVASWLYWRIFPRRGSVFGLLCIDIGKAGGPVLAAVSRLDRIIGHTGPGGHRGCGLKKRIGSKGHFGLRISCWLSPYRSS
ncbi:Unknown protein sequence [Pseudomonas syringae pv. atrofaciens]|nr:Unknown protein sequence [Pseudomonas syringae pv. atrofaciens]